MKKLLKMMAAALCMAAVITQVGCGREQEVTEYTKAILELSFQGDSQRAQSVIEGATQKSLEQQYHVFIDSFVAGNITNEVAINELKTAEFKDLVARIFSIMRYSVGEAKKTDTKEYAVPVTIYPSNIFITFQERITADSLKIADKVKAGGYAGTEEEVDQQVMQDIINHSYELLEVSYRAGGYEKAITVDVTVKADEKNQYSISTTEMEKLVVEILRLDEIQG